jgi:hypothetical protein
MLWNKRLETPSLYVIFREEDNRNLILRTSNADLETFPLSTITVAS